MADTSRFDFCPLCGALARDGVCQSCGHRDEKVVKEMEAQRMPLQQPYTGQVQNGYTQPPMQQPYAGQVQNGYTQPPMQQPYAGQVQNSYNQQPMQQPYMGQVQSGYNQQPMQQPYAGQIQNGYNQSYVNQQNYTPAVPPAQPKKNNTVLIVIISLIVVLLITGVAVFVGVRSILNDSSDKNTEEVFDRADDDEENSDEETIVAETDAEETTDATQTDSTEEPPVDEGTPAVDETDDTEDLVGYCYEKSMVTAENWEEEGQDETLPYYSGPYNALKTGLSYEVSFIEEAFYAGEEADFANVHLSVEYPQISGGSPYEEIINDVLYAEYEYYYMLFTEEFKPLMQNQEDTYYCVVDSYVTYMDEKILSVVFREDIYLSLENNPFSMLDFYCVNIDLETGMIMENTEILRLDEAFAVDFREREVAENGEGALTYYSDQEILDMLKDPAYLVAFYTPYGMEIGLNLDDRIVYVMYEDYETFINTY
ncbi:MAG: hypothetical protein J6B90_12310 [Lachnospiraceae bacterium]|nr:hypothetical protein [Lachnospiraceae bacterium]